MSDFVTAWPDWGKWVVLGLLLSGVQAAFMLRRERRRRAAGRAESERLDAVRATGVASTARVMAARDTRTRIGETLYFVIELELEVAATDATPAFTRTVRVPLSPLHLAEFGAGKAVQVRVQARDGSAQRSREGSRDNAATYDVAIDQPTG
ncbi:MAG: hypothetical protein QHC88_19825 [Achromobacter sp.]|uniref:hypothetical protein n=1 Tax=Achromobacter sp. TaxID=134375 RepID=UPI0029B99518|nr:hypothetical protein [Achromobacter sp.]MDX3987504.1 hypothetical protein [Achromobacter sp.]